MKNAFFFLTVFAISVPLFPQTGVTISNRVTERVNRGETQLLVWLEFTDKGAMADPRLVEQHTIVSQKSLERRQNVFKSESLIDFSDLPIYNNYITRLEEIGVRIKNKSRWFNSVSAIINPEQLYRLRRLDFIKQIDEVARLRSTKPVNCEGLIHGQAQDPAGDNPLDLSYGTSLSQVQQINVPAMHNLGYHGEGMIIGVLDAGFNRLSHEAFNQMQIIAAYDFVNHDPGVGDSTDLGSGTHGTMTLSAIGGYKAGQLIGPAFKAQFVLAKTENTFSETPIEEDNWIAAIEWADSIGVQVTSTSLGYLDFDPPYASYSWQNMDGNTCRITIAADLAVKKGIAVYNSAGNEGYNDTHNTLIAPADGDSVVAVGAVSYAGSRADFSSVGNTIDGRIKPDIMAMGSGVYLASPYNDMQYSYGSGTSFSCPLAAGAAALVLQANPMLTPIQLREALKKTASNAQSPNREYGWGILNAFAARQYSSTGGREEALSEKQFVLRGNFPNPFNPKTTISFSLRSSALVQLTIFDGLGRELRTVMNEECAAGEHNIAFEANGLASGIYFYRLKVGDNLPVTGKMTYQK